MERREFLRWLSIAGLGFVVDGCSSLGASLERIGRHAVTGSPTGTWLGGSIPSPQAGLVLPINRSPGVWAEYWLFEGFFSLRSLITSHPLIRGQLIFVKNSISHAKISPPIVEYEKNNVLAEARTIPILLSTYPAQYTLVVFHQNARRWVVEIEVRRFRTTGYPFNDEFVSGGKTVYADQIIKLKKCKPYENRKFKFHRTFYPGHALMQAFGY